MTGSTNAPLITYKGFDSDLKCRDFQYEIGKEYENPKGAEACFHGFHACEHPLDVFTYYAPAGSRFAMVEQSGVISRHDSDSKVASSKIKVSAEIGLPGIIKAAIEYTFSRAKPTGDSNTSTFQGAASSTGDFGAASSTGDFGAATASGLKGRAMGAMGNALFLVHRNEKLEITKVGAAIVGQQGIKPNTWYELNELGEFTECNR